jgi:multiple sugar transport system permease protein
MKKKHLIHTIILTLLALITLLPMLFMFTNSFMSAKEAVNRYTDLVTPYNVWASEGNIHYYEVDVLPSYLSFETYVKAMDPTYLRMFWNSVLITVPILLGQLIISPLAAYGFEFLTWKYKELLFFLYIIVMLLPIQLLLVPHYIAANLLHLNDTWWAIIIPAAFSPFGTFLLRQHLKGLDTTILDAARVEGENEWNVFRKVALPAMYPSLVALFVLTFVECWNIVDQSIVFIKDVFNEPLSVYLARMVTAEPGKIFAAATIYMIPAILIFMLTNEYLIKGINLATGVQS